MGRASGSKRKRDDGDRPGRGKRFKSSLVRVASLSAAPAVTTKSLMLFGPKTKSLKMLYGDTNYSLSGTGLNPVIRDFAANGLFDPDITGAGHQPRGYDQLMALYKKYVVTGVKVECWFAAPAAGESYVNPLPFIMYRETNAAITDFTDIMERPNLVFADGCFAGTETATGAAMATGRGKYMSVYFDVVKLKGMGKSREEFLHEDSLQGSKFLNPSDMGYISIGWIRNSGSSVDTCNVPVTVRLTYYTTLLEPITPPAS